MELNELCYKIISSAVSCKNNNEFSINIEKERIFNQYQDQILKLKKDSELQIAEKLNEIKCKITNNYTLRIEKIRENFENKIILDFCKWFCKMHKDAPYILGNNAKKLFNAIYNNEEMRLVIFESLFKNDDCH